MFISHTAVVAANIGIPPVSVAASRASFLIILLLFDLHLRRLGAACNRHAEINLEFGDSRSPDRGQRRRGGLRFCQQERHRRRRIGQIRTLHLIAGFGSR